jgi:GH43 family beta-xylosidase
MKWNIFKRFKRKKEVEEPQISMTPREFVLSKLPNAVCSGSITAEKVRTFTIYENSETDAKIIGVSNKKRMAWRQAKINLKG